MTEPILPLRPEVTVWGIRDSRGLPHIRQANDDEMERLGLDTTKFQPWSDGVIDDVNDLAWFVVVLEESKAALGKYPEAALPSWYKTHRAEQERGNNRLEES